MISDPPSDGKFQKLKTELVKTLLLSKEQQLRKLREHEEMGDKTASQFLRHLQRLGGVAVPKDLLRTIWTNRFPLPLQQILATQPEGVSIETLVNLADRVKEIAQPFPTIAATATLGNESSLLE